MQAKRRVYTLQSGSKAAAGKRKRVDAATADGASAGGLSASINARSSSFA